MWRISQRGQKKYKTDYTFRQIKGIIVKDEIYLGFISNTTFLQSQQYGTPRSNDRAFMHEQAKYHQFSSRITSSMIPITMKHPSWKERFSKY
ncbi:hypothetical protein SESBI_12917 [Sesbania bispinosa]|nr:hypothetical protein SESBI_12917 [Sesbania bispinosa]